MSDMERDCWRYTYDDWKLDNGDDEQDERDRREQERDDAEVRAELRAERDRDERGFDER